MIIDPDGPGGGVPGDSESIPGNSSDDDDNTIDAGNYLDNDGRTSGYNSIGDNDGLDPGNPENGMSDGGDPASNAVSPDPNEDNDSDEVTVNPDGSVSIDENRLSDGYESIGSIINEIRNIVNGGSNETPQVDEITALGEQFHNFHEDLTGIGESTDDSSSGELFAADAAGVTVVVIIGAAVPTGGDDKQAIRSNPTGSITPRNGTRPTRPYLRPFASTATTPPPTASTSLVMVVPVSRP